MKKIKVLSYGVASMVAAAAGQAHAEWLATPVDNLFNNVANWNGGLVLNQFTADSSITAITVGANQSVINGTAGTTVNGPFTISAPTSSFVFSGGIFSAGSGAVFNVTAAATAATQTINSDIYQAARTTAAAKIFTANAPIATSKFIINGNYNYQTAAASGITVAGVSESVTFNGNGYGVYNGIIANGNAAANGAVTAGNVYVVRNGGTWELNGANTFSGGVELQNNNGSTTILGNKSALGTGALRIAAGFTGYTIRSNTDLSGANAVPNTINYTSRYGATTTTNASLTFALGSNTATLNSGTTPAVGDVIITGGALNYLPLYTRVTAVSGTTITLSNTALATGTGTGVATAPVNVDGGGGTLAINGTTNLELSGTQNLTTTYSTLAAATQTFAVSNTGTTTFSGVLQQQGGVASINKSLAGTLVLTAANTYTGTTSVANGGGTLYLGSGVATFGAGANTVTVGNGANVGARTGDNVTIPNAISGGGRFLQSGTGTTTLTGNNTYTGGTVISGGGTLNIGGINAIGGANYGSVAGTGLTFTGGGGTLQYAATLTSNADLSADAGGVAKLVSFQSIAAIDTNGHNVTFANTVGNGGTGGLTKVGVGTLTVTASNYTGATTVKGGTLALKTGAQTPVLTGVNGADVQAGKLVLDYAGGTDPVAQVKSILDAGYALPVKFATGQIRSTTLAANALLRPGLTLGYGDDAANSQVIIRTTLEGDADLDGDVDFNDFLALQTNFGQSGTRFDQGNFDYSGATDFNDFLSLQTNFGQSVGGFDVAFTAEEVAAVTAFASANVPEPTSLALAGLGGLLLGRRRRTAR